LDSNARHELKSIRKRTGLSSSSVGSLVPGSSAGAISSMTILRFLMCSMSTRLIALIRS